MYSETKYALVGKSSRRLGSAGCHRHRDCGHSEHMLQTCRLVRHQSDAAVQCGFLGNALQRKQLLDPRLQTEQMLVGFLLMV